MQFPIKSGCYDELNIVITYLHFEDHVLKNFAHALLIILLKLFMHVLQRVLLYTQRI